MAVTTSRRPSAPTRRVSYAFGVLAGVAGLFIVNVWPGWEAVPFLTAETTEVLWLVNFSLLVGIAANVVYLGYDAPWLVSLGGVVTTAIGLAAVVRLMQVFPVDFSAMAVDLTVLVRVVLIAAIVGTAIGIVVQLVALMRAVAGGGEQP